MDAMKVRGLDSFRGDPERAAAVARASEVLELVVGRSAATTVATWTPVSDPKGRPILRLTLTDWTGDLSTDFTPVELTRGSHLEGRLIGFWGDFLQKSSHVLIEPILRSIQEHGGIPAPGI